MFRALWYMKILDGKARADFIMRSLKKEITALPTPPGLGVILVGVDKASGLYVSLKEKRGRELGVRVSVARFSQDAKEEVIARKIKDFNADSKIQGILIQLPLPKHINADKLIALIAPSKDVDGLLSESTFVSPLLQAIEDLLCVASRSLEGKRAVIFANSNHFREHLCAFLARKGIQCIEESQDADIVISAKGEAGFVRADMIRPGAIVIDVGITEVGGTVKGDVDEGVFAKTELVSPVPGGVGPLTIAYLFKNLVRLAATTKLT